MNYDRILSEFLESIGPWSNHVIIGGGFSLFIYKLYFSGKDTVTNFPVGTRDIDLLIPRKMPRVAEKNIADYLNEAGFTHLFKDRHVPPSESYVKKIDGIEVELEFLTDNVTRKDKEKNVVCAGVVAQPLSYLTLSLKTTQTFQTYSQKNGRVVSAGAWIFHKGLTFKRRVNSSKRLKDLYGIWYVITQLEDFSNVAVNEFFTLTGQHGKWFETFKGNLTDWLVNTTPEVWSMLENQDPSGRLTKLTFERSLQKLLG